MRDVEIGLWLSLVILFFIAAYLSGPGPATAAILNPAMKIPAKPKKVRNRTLNQCIQKSIIKCFFFSLFTLIETAQC